VIERKCHAAFVEVRSDSEFRLPNATTQSE